MALNVEMLRSSSVFAEILDEEGDRREAKGYIKGMRRSLLKLIDYFGVPLTAAERERIQACTDEAQIERWIERLANSTDLFA